MIVSKPFFHVRLFNATCNVHRKKWFQDGEAGHGIQEEDYYPLFERIFSARDPSEAIRRDTTATNLPLVQFEVQSFP